MIWNKITECLPDVHKTDGAYESVGVLVTIVTIKGDRKTCFREYERACIRGKTVYRWKYPWDYITDENITHWAYLPEPAEEVCETGSIL